MAGKKHWDRFPHGADTGVRGLGSTKEEAFEQAAMALTSVTTDPHRVKPLEKISVRCEAPDDELLFADWLNALICEAATRGMLFSRFRVKIRGHILKGEIWGEKVDVPRHRPAVEVKGATYTEMKVNREPDGSWMAQCVVDV